jgi:uncharacterized membrane-anchored protein
MVRGPFAGTYARSQTTLMAALVMLAGAVAAFAAKAQAIALVFLVLMLACAVVSCVFAVMFRNRGVAAARAARRQAQQKAQRTRR